jgi:dTDP-4-dehydrorhamnose reductase
MQAIKVLITGSSGQLGQALLQSRPAWLSGQPLELLSTSRPGSSLLHDDCNTASLDLADPSACYALVEQYRPDWLINVGAYTNVDLAEQETELAMSVNCGAPRAFAQALCDIGYGRLLQISTDFVFSGQQGSPYKPDQILQPLGSYGRSKAAGEQAVAELLGPGRAVILRTSWVYGPIGRNFLLTMLSLHQKRVTQGDVLSVVADQVGCPTNTVGLAQACWQVLNRFVDHSLPHVLHWSDAGACTWYDFATAIGELAVEVGLLQKSAQTIPIRTVDYPTPAQRPSYSLLDCTQSRLALGLDATHWRSALHSVLVDLHDQNNT